MFEEIDRYPLCELLQDRFGLPFPPACLRGDWQRLGPDRKAPVQALADRYRDEPYALLTAGQYMAFERAGDRRAMEVPYFQRRRKLIAALMGACVGDAPEEDMDIVVDGIWLICEETSWVISAHNGGELDGVQKRRLMPLPDPERPYVDLFAAQTAMILSMTCYLLSDALDDISPLIRRRVRHEVERRVLIPFETRSDFWWMGLIRRDMCNWTPWIASNVAVAACTFVRDRLRLCEVLEKCCRLIDRYLDTVPGDGGCAEGVGYFGMAAGAVLDFWQLMEQQLGDRRFGRPEKLARMMRFPLDMWLGGDWFANFGDCDARARVPGERLQCAGKRLKLPELVAFGARFRGDPTDAISDTPNLWRLMNSLKTPPRDPGEIEPPESAWLENLQIRRLTRGGATLVCKGGVNAGSHSHIDCGGFIYFAEGEVQIADAGNMTYTRKTFSGQRDRLWNIRSKYHSVPVIGPWEQASGESYRARDVACRSDGLELDIAGAYPEAAGVRALKRRFALGQDGALALRDQIRLNAPMPVTETLMLRHEPRVAAGLVRSGAVDISFDPAAAVEIEEIPVTDPRMANSFPGSLWRAALTWPAGAEHDIEITIGRHPHE